MVPQGGEKPGPLQGQTGIPQKVHAGKMGHRPRTTGKEITIGQQKSLSEDANVEKIGRTFLAFLKKRGIGHEGLNLVQ